MAKQEIRMPPQGRAVAGGRYQLPVYLLLLALAAGCTAGGATPAIPSAGRPGGGPGTGATLPTPTPGVIPIGAPTPTPSPSPTASPPLVLLAQGSCGSTVTGQSTGIVVTPSAVTIDAGASFSLLAIATNPADITWASSNQAIVTVTPQGQVTGVAAGTATVTATSSSLTASVTVTVRASSGPPVVSAVILRAPGTPSPTVPQGRTLAVCGVVVLSDGTTNQNLSWSSSNSAVATVDQVGVVTGNSPGTATISAVSSQDATKSASLAVTVTPLGLSGLAGGSGTSAF